METKPPHIPPEPSRGWSLRKSWGEWVTGTRFPEKDPTDRPHPKILLNGPKSPRAAKDLPKIRQDPPKSIPKSFQDAPRRTPGNGAQQTLMSDRSAAPSRKASSIRRSAERRARKKGQSNFVLNPSCHTSSYFKLAYLPRSWQLDCLYIPPPVSSRWTFALVPLRHLGAGFSPLGRILGDKMAFQEKYKNTDFSIAFPLFWRPGRAQHPTRWRQKLAGQLLRWSSE